MNDLNTATTSFIRVGSTAGGATTFTQTGGFVNNGVLDLTNLAAGANLARVLVQNGTLENSPSGLIQTLAGAVLLFGALGKAVMILPALVIVWWVRQRRVAVA